MAPANPDPRPIRGYGALLTVYSSLTALSVLGLRRRRVPPLSPYELVLYGLATEHLSRLLAKDSVTAVLRAPFTQYEEPAGEGEVNEAVVGTGLRHAVGELVSCPFCLGQWIATGLIVGRELAPGLTGELSPPEWCTRGSPT